MSGKPHAQDSPRKKKRGPTPRQTRKRFDAKRRAEFLKMLAAGESVERAARAIGFSRRYMYDVKEKDPEFRADWQDAFDASTEEMERIARARALGWHETRVAPDGTTTTIEKYSDLLMIFMLKARKPDTYRDRIDVNQRIETRVEIDLLPVMNGNVLTLEQARAQLPPESQRVLPSVIRRGSELEEGNENDDEG